MKRLITTTAVLAALAAPAFTESQNAPGAPQLSRDAEMPAKDDPMATGGMGAYEPSMFNAPAPDIAREGYVSLDYDQLTVGDLSGADVFDANDQNIGEVDQLFLTDSGELHGAIIEVGGFLGLAEKPVLVSMDSLTIQKSDDGDVQVYVDASRATLEAVKAYQF